MQETLEQGQATVPDQAESPEPKWVPVNGSHAIQMAYASVNFAQPVTAVIWNNVLNAARTAAETSDLDKEIPIQTMTFQIGVPAGQGDPPIPSSNPGFQFQRLQSPNLIGEQFVVMPDQIRFETYSYTRWAGFKSKVQALFNAVLPVYFTAVNTAQISLEYTDVFHWSDGGDADCSEIVDRKSELMAVAAIQPLGQWHSHSGWFDNQQSGRRRLSNADITVADALVQNQPRRAISIRTHEATQFLIGHDGVPIDGPPPIDNLFELFDAHHHSLKNSLSKMLTPAARQMISLGVSNA